MYIHEIFLKCQKILKRCSIYNDIARIYKSNDRCDVPSHVFVNVFDAGKFKYIGIYICLEVKFIPDIRSVSTRF